MSKETALEKINDAEKRNSNELDLSSEQLSSEDFVELLPQIRKLKNLQLLNLDNNKLTNIEPLKQLTNLRTLYLSNTQLTNIEPLKELANLRRLYLRDCKLTNIDPLKQLTNLQSLNLDNNKLTNIEPLKELINLLWLSLENNQLTTIEPLKKLTDLRVLYLSNTQLTNIEPLKELTNLHSLYLDNNKLTNIEPLKELINLQSLILGTNELTNIDPLKQLTNLHSLYLDNNKLTNIEPLKKLINLQVLFLFNNPLPIPEEILTDYENPQKIINYYLQSVEGRPLNEAKVVVIGEAYVGKTSLIKRLLNEKFDPGESRTHGIRIRKWENVPINNQNVKLNIWDFGGQEIMHATHQFFFTKRTVYVILVNVRENMEKNRIEYWLKKVESISEDSPVLIVGNKIDDEKVGEQAFDINREDLRRKFPKMIRGFFPISCNTEKKQFDHYFEKFKQSLIDEVSKLKDINYKFPNNWFEIKKQLEDMQEKKIPYISNEKYLEKCLTAGITKDLDRETLVEFLNDLGTVLRFEDTNILNPEWVTQSVYAIVDHPPLIHEKGVLTLEKINELLPRPKYTRKEQLLIMDMMREFELCLDIVPNKKFLVPGLLQQDEPETGDWGNTLRFVYQYEVYFDSIITRFIVRMHSYIRKKTYWRSGVVLEYEKNKAIVKGDVDARRISIFIDGEPATRQMFLAIIRKEFNEIHGTFSNLSVEELVPNPDYPEVERPYKRLREMEQKHIENEFIEGLGITYPVKKWLNGIEPEEKRKEEYDKKPIVKPNKAAPKNSFAVRELTQEMTTLREDIAEFNTYKLKLNEEADNDVKAYAMVFYLIFAAIVILWISLIFIFGWDVMEPFTYIIAALSFLLTIGYSIWTYKEFNTINFIEARRQKQRLKIYQKFELDIGRQNARIERLQKLGEQLESQKNNSQRLIE